MSEEAKKDSIDSDAGPNSPKAWEKPVVMRLNVGETEGANNYDDDMDFKGAS